MLSTSYEVFFEVASCQSFSKASRKLYLTQPAVSKHVKKLEHELGISLFIRQGNTISLTQAGKKLYESLHQAKIIQNSIKFDLGVIKKLEEARGTLSLGSSTTLSLYMLPKIISLVHKKYPNIQIQLLNRNTENVLKALLNKEIDLGVIEGEHKISAVSYQYFTDDEVIAVCSVHSPFAGKTIDLQDLRQIPLALREQGSGTLSALYEALEKKGLKPKELNVNIKIGGTEALKNFLKEDVCLGFLPRRSVSLELENKTMKEVEIEGLTIHRKFYFIMRQGEEQAGIIREFIKTARLHYN
ncbi:LysR substrate-binding domain-containing protein [Fulvivirgaceae bacterium BMA12]|uniref:LysR substrate-binding domain-containing protein n=1 Tax=Agaribacillus aureus TaxID=3051825 RepID=A0ABT8L0G6_9BACT|nr:LysR substrate-binding domain-containing protein [Fulvivirgaceae bacterium BMA12]